MKYAKLSPRNAVLRIIDTADQPDRDVTDLQELTDEQAGQVEAIIAQRQVAVWNAGAVVNRYDLLNHRWNEATKQFEPRPEHPAPPVRVPGQITAWQARAALQLTPFGDGTLLDAVDAAIAALPGGAEKIVVQSAWDNNANFVRNSPTITGIATALGLDDAAVDQLFILGGGLEV